MKTREFGKLENLKTNRRNFPGGPVVKNLPSNAGDLASIPGGETEISQAAWCSQKENRFLKKLR